jgi:hypothetical protein
MGLLALLHLPVAAGGCPIGRIMGTEGYEGP